MKSLVRESGWFKGVTGFRTCSKCAREIGPKLLRNNLGGMVLRAPCEGMVQEPDPAAERKRQKKERKGKANMTRQTLGIVKLFIRGQAAAPQIISEECPDCLVLNRVA